MSSAAVAAARRGRRRARPAQSRRAAGLQAVARLHAHLPEPAGADPAGRAGLEVGDARLGGVLGGGASPRALAAYRLTFGAAFVAAAVNVVFGLVTAWVLARYDFPGKGFVDALVDLPFALPTAVAGIALTALYAENGWLGRFLEPLGIKVAFAPRGRRPWR